MKTAVITTVGILLIITGGVVFHIQQERIKHELENERVENDRIARINAIEQVLRLDHKINESFKENDSMWDQFWDESNNYDELVRAMRSSDISKCPPDFQTAYENHIRAWQQKATLAHKYAGFNDALKTITSGGTVVIEIMHDNEKAHAAIEDTYNEVVLVAHRYGAKSPSDN
jgi:hypothetical protein